MKKFLSFVLALVVILSLSANVVFADEYVANLVTMYESMGMTADDIATELAGYGLILDTENMQIINGTTGAALTEEEFNAYMGGGASSGTPTSPSGSALTEEDYKSEKVAYQVEKVGLEQKEGDTEKKLYFKVTVYVMGTDAYLDYLLETGAAQQATYTDSTFMEKRAIKVNEMDVSENDLVSQLGIGYVAEDGFLTSCEQYIVPMSDLSELMKQDQDMDGTPDYKKGDVIMTLAFKFGDDIQIHEITVGQSNSKVITNTDIKWVTVIIIILGLVVVLLGIFIVLIALKNKKKVEKQNSLKDAEYVSEDEVFEELVDEAGVDFEDEEIEESEEETEESEETEEIEEVEESEEDSEEK